MSTARKRVGRARLECIDHSPDSREFKQEMEDLQSAIAVSHAALKREIERRRDNNLPRLKAHQERMFLRRVESTHVLILRKGREEEEETAVCLEDKPL